MTSRELAARVLIETLKLTKESKTPALEEVARASGTSAEVARKLLEQALRSGLDPTVSVSSRDRFRIAFLAAKEAGLDIIARALSWQEFEKFAEECLVMAGFLSELNVRVRGRTRSWQVDVVGTKSGLMACFDCKHWKPPSYLSKFRKAAVHQRVATGKLLESRIQAHNAPLVAGLPVILTLRDPPSRVTNGSVLLSIQRLPDFLANLNPFMEDLPFIWPSSDVEENPMRAIARTGVI